LEIVILDEGTKNSNLLELINLFLLCRRFFDPLAVALDDAFPGQLTITAIKDPGTTGNFEVVIKVWSPISPISKSLH
jgi:hypothetical protein